MIDFLLDGRYLVVVAAGCCYVCFFHWLIGGLKRIRSAAGGARPFISVIIAARNEESRLPVLLAALQQQSYPIDLRELIIVDDRSNDGTSLLLQRWKKILPFCHLRINELFPETNPKKNALAFAIQNACGDVIVTTDADCIPRSGWLESVANAFENDVGAVVGVSLWSMNGKWWSKIVAFESLATTAVSLAAVGHNTPFLAVGRNFAFRRELYTRANGYSRHMHIYSGDDVLLLQSIIKFPEYRVVAVISRESQVQSSGATNLWEFVRQKRRHISAAKGYPLNLQLSYLFYHSSNAVLWFCPLLLGLPGLIFLLIKFVLDGIVLHKTMVRCNVALSRSVYLFWQVLFFFTNLIVGPTAFLGRIQWK